MMRARDHDRCGKARWIRQSGCVFDSLDANNDTGTITIIADSLDKGTVIGTIVTEEIVVPNDFVDP